MSDKVDPKEQAIFKMVHIADSVVNAPDFTELTGLKEAQAREFRGELLQTMKAARKLVREAREKALKENKGSFEEAKERYFDDY